MFKKTEMFASRNDVDTSKIFPRAKEIAAYTFLAVAAAVIICTGSHHAKPEAPAQEAQVVQVHQADYSLR